MPCWRCPDAMRYYRTKKSKRYPKGRICQGTGCTTVLSTYNADTTCASCWSALLPA